MKPIIAAAVLLFSAYLKSNAQLDSVATKKLGDKLIRYSQASTGGISLQELGVCAVITGAYIDAKPEDKNGTPRINTQPFYLTGGVLFLVGLIVNIGAQSRIHEAGFILRSNGIAYELPIRKRK